MFGKVQRFAQRMLGISPRVSGEYWGSAFGRPTLAGVGVDERTALGITAVWSAVNLYASTIAALPFDVVERGPEGGSSPARDHWAYDLVHSAVNEHQTSELFRETICGHALTFGNGYAEIDWSADGRTVRRLALLDPREVTPELGDDHRLRYKLGRSGGNYLDPSDIIHIRGFGFDGVTGLSPIAIARETLGTAMAQQAFEGALFGNGAHPIGFFECPGHLTDSQMAAMRQSINDIHQGPRKAGKFGILTGGVKWVQSSFSPEDAQMILARGFSVAEVARLYRIPPHMLGLMEGATVGNAEQQAIQFVRFSLLPWLKRIEAEYNLKLFGPLERRRFSVRIDVDSIEAGDMEARSIYRKTLFGCGVLSINEWRLAEGMRPLADPNADQHFIPTNNLQAIETLPTDRPTQPGENQTDGQ